MVASLLKGFDYEEALLLLLVLLVLHQGPAGVRPPRRVLRHAVLGGVAGGAGRARSRASLWLGMFAFKHVDYSHELWWQFELHGEASRFLRASVGAAVVVLLFAWPG